MKYWASTGAFRPIVNVVVILVFTMAFVFSSLFAAEQRSNDNTQAELFETLSQAQTQLDGRLAEDAVWQYWFDQAPSMESRALLDAAIDRREAYDFEAAESHLDQLVQLAPDYSEAYNQRAFVRFLRENYSGAQADLAITLTMEPRHFGALAGLFQVHSRTGEHDDALARLKQAVIIHPWLRERNALPEVHWPKSYRNIHAADQDI